MSALDELLKKHRKKIIDRETRTFRALLSAYAEIEKDLKKSFDELQRKIADAEANGEEISPSWFFNEKRLKNLLSQVNEQIKRFGGKASQIIENEQKQAINIAVDHSQDTYKFLVQNAPKPKNFPGALNTKNVETAVGLMGDGSPLVEYFEQQLAPMVADLIKSEVIKASALGTSFKQIAKSLEQTGQITKYRAFSVARTEVNRVRRETTRQIFNENNDLIEKWEWVTSKSVRTCPLCLAMDGKIFDLSEPFPQHINCRCSMMSVLRGLKPLPRTLGKDWFEKQTDETKAKILGKDSFEAYQDNDLTLDDFVTFRNDKRFGKSVSRKPLAKILADKGIDPVKKTKTPKPKNPITPKVSKPVSVAIPDFKNIKEAGTWLETKYPHLQADFSQTKLETIQPTIKEFVRLSDEFPDVNKRLEYIGTYRDKTKKFHTKNGYKFSGETAHASVNGKRIGLNPKFYNNPVMMEKALEHSTNTNFLVSGKVESTITHEFGHQIEHWLKSVQLHSLTDLKSSKYEFRPILEKFYQAFYQDYKFKSGTNYAEWKKRREDLEKDVSRYGMKKEAELWAESFTASVFKPESKRGQLLKEFLEKVKELEFNANPKSLVAATTDEVKAADDKFAEILKKFEFLDNLP